jgi:hypothetical protein
MIDLLQNFFDFFRPHERLGILVIESNEILDGCDQLGLAFEHPALIPLARDLIKPSFNQIHPRGTRRGTMQMEPSMLLQPLFHLRVVVRPIVVQDQVKGQPWGRFSVDFAQELQKFLVSMSRVAGPNHRAIQHIERCKQTGGAMLLVVMRKSAASPRLYPSWRVCMRWILRCS